jgi:hypothetical protein
MLEECFFLGGGKADSAKHDKKAATYRVVMER